jgi:superfamily I DNA/RNA helicase
MILTDEQKNIVAFEGDLSVSACAGSGKSSTIVHYCKRRPNDPTLYLAYNKTVKLEAIQKFRQAGLKNVRVETMHSLAHSEMKAQGRKIDLHEKGQYKPLELVEKLGIGKGNIQFGLILATHTLNFLNYYFNSIYRQLSQAREEYLKTLTHPEFRSFAESHFDTIVGYAAQLFKMMYEGELPYTHDAYLKLYMMGNPQLPFKYIAVDEAQDATMALLDMLVKQKATKVLVGDPAQAIYGFRHCVDAMEVMGYPRLSLSTSFRFDQGVADLGMEVLRYKSQFGLPGGESKIIGAGGCPKGAQVGVIARNNILLLAQAIMDLENAVLEIETIGFEGGLKSYTFFGGSSLYDILWLYCKKPEKITDPFIKQFDSFKELIQFQKNVGDKELKTLISIVSVFGAGLFSQISGLRKKQTDNRASATRMYTTCHKSKGLEYASVELLGFIDQWDIDHALKHGEYPKLSKKEREEGKVSQGIDYQALNDELNCSYVAITRAEKDVEILPDPFDEVPDMVKENREKMGGSKNDHNL